MKEPPDKSGSKPSPADLVTEFCAYLHLVITAGQLQRSKQLESLPGPKMLAYCHALRIRAVLVQIQSLIS